MNGAGQPAAAGPSQQPLQSGMPANAVQGGQGSVADDGDVIEKAWVSRVQQIIAATAQDPYEQNRQITELKAEYMLKRYGKTVKSSD